MTPVEVLASHQAVLYVGDGVWWCRCDKGWTPQHQLDMLAEVNIAVVELPTIIPDEWGYWTVDVPMGDLPGNRQGFLRFEPGGENYRGVQLPDRIASLGVPSPLEVRYCRGYAAALIAAAIAAENGSTT